MSGNTILKATIVSAVAIGCFAATARAQGQIDTLLSVDATRLEVDNLHGDITVSTWDRGAIRVRASSRLGVDIYYEDGVVEVSGEPDHRGGKTPIDFEITVPRDMDIEVETVNGQVVVRNAGGSVEAESVKGQVDVTGGRTVVDLSSVAGRVSLSGARGAISVESVNESVVVRDVVGDVEAETVNGGIDLTGIDARRVDASSINGRIMYDGTLYDDGWYEFETHNGTIVLRLPANPQAHVTISTFNGEIRSDFQTRVTRGGHEGTSFKLGSGGAHVSLETFNGSVELRRRQ